MDYIHKCSIEATNRHARAVACSAVTGAGLQTGLDWLVEDVGQRIFFLE